MSRIRIVRTALTAIGAAIIATACAPEAGVAPLPPAPPAASVSHSNDLLSTVGSILQPVTNLLTVPVEPRSTPLAQDISVTQTIGSSGGTITIPAAGLTVKFAPGAVSQNTTITATAYAGGYVSYGFEPHGLVFNAPVTLTQDMSKVALTSRLLSLLTLHGAYVPGNAAGVAPDGTISVSQLLNVTTTSGLLGNLTSASFTLPHFSGYILAGK